MYIVYTRSYVVSRSTSILERRETNEVATNIEHVVHVLWILSTTDSRNAVPLTYSTPVAGSGTALPYKKGLTISPFLLLLSRVSRA